MTMTSIAALRAMQARTICLGSHSAIIQSMLDYEYMCGHETPSIVAIISQGRKQERYFWGEQEIEIPLYASVDALPADQKRHAQCLLSVQSGRRVLAGMRTAFAALPQLRVAVLFAEQVPERHALELLHLAAEHHVVVIGPSSVGLLVPGALKLGAIGGTQPGQLTAALISEPGDTAVISTSGGVVNELIYAVTTNGRRVSFAMALGGDRFPITSPADAFLMAQADPRTKQIIYFGELGGQDEYDIARLIESGKITKKVVAYVAGMVAELFDAPPQFGHAKAMAGTPQETASAKKQALRSAGVTVIDSLSELAGTLVGRKSVAKATKATATQRRIGPRKQRLMASHISGDMHGETQLLGADLLKTIDSHTLPELILSMLLGRPVSAPQLTAFTDYTLRLLSDHGPYVSGAAITIITARAGKDLVSSLAAGLLTIGPRFGGAINAAAGEWLRGVQSGQGAKEFVEAFSEHGGVMPGIGHKKYRIDMPDPRVTALRAFAASSSDSYLDFALDVQEVTTSKKGNLILNVDGAIAAIMLDLLTGELGYTPEQLQELVAIEFFNALFVLSRSVGLTAHYLDQRRHDEGLLRLTDEEIGYFPEA